MRRRFEPPALEVPHTCHATNTNGDGVPVTCMRILALVESGRPEGLSALKRESAGLQSCPPATSRKRKVFVQSNDFLTNRFEESFVAVILKAAVNPVADFLHLGFLHAACGDRRRSDADPATLEGAFGVEGDAVLVHRDASVIEGFLGNLAVEAVGAEIDEHEVIVRAAGAELVAMLNEPCSEGLGVLDDLGLVLGKARLEGFAKADGLGGDDVHQWPALNPGEDLGIEFLDVVLVVREDDAAARTAQALVRGGGNEVRVLHRAGVNAASDEAGNVCHVDEEVGANAPGDLAHTCKVDGAWIGGGASGDHLWLTLLGEFLQAIIVDGAVRFGDAVVDDIVEVATEIGGVSVGEVPAVAEVHRQNAVAGFEEGEVNGGVGLGAGVRLDIGKLGAEELADALDGEVLDLVDFFAAPVPAFCGVALGVFVGEAGALGGHDGTAGEIFGSDELDVVALALLLVAHDGGDGGIGSGEDVEGMGVGVHFAYAARVAPGVGEGSFEPGIDHGGGLVGREFLAAETKDVGSVVLARDGGDFRAGDEGGLNA